MDRKELISHTVGEIDKGLSAREPYVGPHSEGIPRPTEPPFNANQSIRLLNELGFTSSRRLISTNDGPEKGADLTFTIQSTSGNSIRSDTEVLFQAQMKAIGIKINIQNYDINTLFGTNWPHWHLPNC